MANHDTHTDIPEQPQEQVPDLIALLAWLDKILASDDPISAATVIPCP